MINRYPKKILRFVFTSLLAANFWVTYCSATQFNPTLEDPPNFIELQNNSQNQMAVLSISGKISKGLYEKIKLNIEKLDNQNIQPGRLIVLIDSMGGDAEAALKIGRLLRKNNAFIFVTNRCASACVYIYTAGVYRSSIPNSIGIHATKVTLNDKNSRVVVELNPDLHAVAKKKLMDFDSGSQGFLDEMNINPSFHEKLRSLSTDKLYWLTANDIKTFGLDGFDSFFIEREFSTLKEAFNKTLSQATFNEKINNTLKQCLYVKNVPHEFAECYKKNLRD
jgi:hypothetical protein